MREPRSAAVYRLVSLPRENPEAILIKRGINAASIPEITSGLENSGVPLTPQEVIDDSFRPRYGASYHTPFKPGRFGDGTAPVFYSALTIETAIAEVRHWLRKELGEMAKGILPYKRYYTVMTCDSSGETLLLCGHEGKYPDLNSPTEAGYPYCRALANSSRVNGVEMFHTPSARLLNGVCSPSFFRHILSAPARLFRGWFFANGSIVDFERENHPPT